MDLPTTDPGSDLCDLTEDSADESFARSERRTSEGKSDLEKRDHSVTICCKIVTRMNIDLTVVWRSTRGHREEIVELSETRPIEKKKREGKRLMLPEIVRPRSVPFGELPPRKDHRKTRQRQRCLRYPISRSFLISVISTETEAKLQTRVEKI